MIVGPDEEVTFDLITSHNFKRKMKKYFPSLPINKYDWVHNPFSVISDIISHLGLFEQEQLLKLQSNR